ncbi:uncharacterized protein LOC134181840 isoform X4 [Corticium candelabrum]|uniref:uncharacterized protein LOC134181840 isoform X4 n=1 Tax=Corticium candelabrum TaxID=121492 RepID=UPI002E26BB8B|nr:uncharacterized protein LOC134181840 isoform X4 [Corticium candelabrum]
MWQYLWVHCVYHLARWFPRNDRRKIRLLLFFFSSALLVPLFIVLLLDQSTRYCSGNLFNLCVASICFTVCMIGFSFLFTLMDPVPWQGFLMVKKIVHLLFQLSTTCHLRMQSCPHSAWPSSSS